MDARCYDLTAPFKRQQALTDSSIKGCDFFENLQKKLQSVSTNLLNGSGEVSSSIIPNGVYTLDDIREYGEQQGLCPYFLSRQLLPSADILIYSYYYLLDPKISEIISKHLDNKAIVVFDEGHNIDNVALEVLSVEADGVGVLDKASFG